MRTKDEILKEAENCLLKKQCNNTKLIGLRYLEVEALIDIRDVIEERLASIDNTILKCLFPKK